MAAQQGPETNVGMLVRKVLGGSEPPRGDCVGEARGWSMSIRGGGDKGILRAKALEWGQEIGGVVAILYS